MLQSSAVTQGVITAILLLGTFYMLINSLHVPDWIQTLDGLVVGFYFGAKIGTAGATEAARRELERRGSP